MRERGAKGAGGFEATMRRKIKERKMARTKRKRTRNATDRRGRRRS